jgi:hypothetical protein
VRAGGSLLLIADHAPMGAAAATLSATFGVDMGKGFTADPDNYERVALDTSWIRFSRSNHGLGDHPITRGREASERINSVLSFTGQSLKGPKESSALLKLSARAYDVDNLDHPEKARMTSASGRAQAVALPFGRGRVVVFGEAAMVSKRDGTPRSTRSSAVSDSQYCRGPSVAIQPGARQFTRIRSVWASEASLVVMQIMPALATSYPGKPPAVFRPCHSAEIDAMFTIAPPFPRRIASIAQRVA